MASVQLSRFEIQQRMLPRMCVHCGDRATVAKRKKFVWCPPWVAVLLLAGVIPYVIVAVILTKRMTVHVPFCDRHESHWRWRNLVIWLSLAAIVVICCGGLITASVLTRGDRQFGRHNPNRAVTGLACAGSAALGFAWLVTVIILQTTSIRPTEITDDDIRLTHVSQSFVDALYDDRRRDRAAHSRQSPSQPGVPPPLPPKNYPHEPDEGYRRGEPPRDRGEYY